MKYKSKLVKVTFSVEQLIAENDTKRNIESTYCLFCWQRF